MMLFVVAAICLIMFLGAIALGMAAVHCCMRKGNRDEDMVIMPEPAPQASPYPAGYDPDPTLIALVDAIRTRQVPPGGGAGGPGKAG